MVNRRGLIMAFAALLLLVLLTISFVVQLQVPGPTGPHAVGRTTRQWVDAGRREVLGPADGPRETPLVIWYPAQAGTGLAMPYFPALQEVAAGMAASGEVSALEVFGLRFVRSQERLQASMAEAESRYPLVLLSPGNGTNVEFYDAVAAELASQGYIVVGVNHPYDVAAVALHDGRVAQFVEGPLALTEREAWTAGRIAERTADLLFVLAQLQALNEQGDVLLSGRMELAQVGVMGHSLGGIAAVQSCQASAEFVACLNLDGLQRGGPFSADDNPAPPPQPFMMITKEAELHPELEALFAAAPSGSYRVVLRGATHDSFTDGPLLQPSLLPNGAQAIASQVRVYTLAFFEQTLRGRESALLQQPVQSGDVSLEVYPRRQAAR